MMKKMIAVLAALSSIVVLQGWGYTCSPTAPVKINQIYSPQAGGQIGYIELYVGQGPVNLKDWNICYSDNSGNEKCIKVGEGDGDLYLNGVRTSTDNPPTNIPNNAFLVYPETLFVTGNRTGENTFSQSKGEAILLNASGQAVHYLRYTTAPSYNNPEWSTGASCMTDYTQVSARHTGICATPDFSLSVSQWNFDCNNTMGLSNSAVSPTPAVAFDAWEPTITDSPTAPIATARKIYSKVVNSPTFLKIGSMTYGNSTYINSTSSLVGWRLVNSSTCPNGDDAITAWSDLNLSGTASFPNPATISFTPTKASKDVRIQFATKNTDYTDRNCSTDNFSIRPAYFSGTISGFKAGEQKTLLLTTIDANGSNNTNALEYNTTVSTISNISISNKCESNTTSELIDNLAVTFENGKSTVINAKFKDIGDFNATLIDSSWNDGDCISASGSNTLDNGKYGCNIEGTIGVVVSPYELNTTLKSFMTPSMMPTPWLYLDSSRAQHVEINATIQAFGKDGTLNKNFSDGCSASAVPLGFYFTPTGTIPSDLNVSLTSATGSTPTVPNLNSTYTSAFNGQFFTIPGTSFKNGDSNLSLKFNFIRSDSAPINPFDLNLTSIKTSSGYVDNNDTNLSEKATFVYGRIRGYDIQTNLTEVPNPIEIEIYGKNNTNTFLNDKPQNVLYWYRNTDHNSSASGSILSGSSTPDILDINTTKNPPNPNHGLNTVYITNNTGITTKQTINLVIPSWLTMTPANNTFLYQYIAPQNGTDTLTPTTIPSKGVNTGTFGGSDFGITAPKNTTKKGIKVFR